MTGDDETALPRRPFPNWADLEKQLKDVILGGGMLGDMLPERPREQRPGQERPREERPGGEMSGQEFPERKKTYRMKTTAPQKDPAHTYPGESYPGESNPGDMYSGDSDSWDTYARDRYPAENDSADMYAGAGHIPGKKAPSGASAGFGGQGSSYDPYGGVVPAAGMMPSANTTTAVPLTGAGMKRSLDRRMFVQGLILSEILQPPRAKRPHRTRWGLDDPRSNEGLCLESAFPRPNGRGSDDREVN